MDDLVRRVRAARAYAGFTLDELAERAEIGRSTLVRIEKGRAPKQRELNAIAEACDVPRAWFSAPFEWLDEAEVVAIDVPIPEDAGAITSLVADAVDGRLALVDFAVSVGVQSVQAPPRDFSRTAYAVLERSGRLFWWAAQGPGLTFLFARPVPGGIGAEEPNAKDETLVRLVALQDLLESWIGAAVLARDFARKIAKRPPPSAAGDVDPAVALGQVEEMEGALRGVRAVVDRVVAFTTSDLADDVADAKNALEREFGPPFDRDTGGDR